MTDTVAMSVAHKRTHNYFWHDGFLWGILLPKTSPAGGGGKKGIEWVSPERCLSPFIFSRATPGARNGERKVTAPCRSSIRNVSGGLDDKEIRIGIAGDMFRICLNSVRVPGTTRTLPNGVAGIPNGYRR